MQFAEEGRLLAACVGNDVAGYVAFRISGDEGVIVHLCVAEVHRGRGVAGSLLADLFRETEHLRSVRLLCREDYAAANQMWPRFGFTCVDERVGRGQDRAKLFLWRRLNETAHPLIESIDEVQRRERRTVVVDANVFVHFDCDSDQAEESKSLLADWLEPEIVICITSELLNEITRSTDEGLRSRRRAQMSAFITLEALADEFQSALREVSSVLPEAVSESDHSDRRQLAHAVAKEAEYFVTRDETLLGHAGGLEQTFGIRVVRPSDLVSVIHNDIDPLSYAPARLLGTSIQECAPKSEADFFPFQAFAQGETKAEFLALCRTVRTDPSRFVTRLVSPPGDTPILLYSLAETVAGARIELLRVRNHNLSATVLRRVISEQIIACQQHGLRSVHCADFVMPVVNDVLLELGFRMLDGELVKTSVASITETSSLPALLPRSSGASEPAELERLYWPLKISDSELPSFVIPIRPHWAADLFDVGLAESSLFGADHASALALENVYYSRSPIRIPPNARILWYVSGRVGEVRACSICVATTRGPARDVFRRFRRLGVYEWSDLLEMTDGDTQAEVTAYQFALTERFALPVPWSRLQEILGLHQGHGNPIASPVRIPSSAFIELYSRGVFDDRS